MSNSLDDESKSKPIFLKSSNMNCAGVWNLFCPGMTSPWSLWIPWGFFLSGAVGPLHLLFPGHVSSPSAQSRRAFCLQYFHSRYNIDVISALQKAFPPGPGPLYNIAVIERSIYCWRRKGGPYEFQFRRGKTGHHLGGSP